MMSQQPHLGDLSPAGSVALGIIVGLLSTSIQSVGLTLQRKSHLLEDEKEDELIRRPPYRRRRWQLGMLMFVIANLVGSTIQITTLPLPVLSTLQASGLVFNTICASIILKEPFTRWSFIGTALVAGGAILIAMFGALAEPSHTLSQLLELLARQEFVVWMICTFILIVTILFGIFFINRLPSNPHSHVLRLTKGFAYGGVSSILSAHSLLVAKSAVELLVRTVIDGVNQFNRWQSWVILLLLVFFALTQLYFLHRGLKIVSTSVLYPFVFCIYNIIAIVDGLIYFRQTSLISPVHGVLIAVGTLILLLGVFALSWRLDEERHTAPPAEAHTLLTPGMGIVEDTTTDDETDNYDLDNDNASVTSADEEAGVHGTSDVVERTPVSERTPLLLRRSTKSSSKTRTLKNHNDPLHIMKKRHRQRFATAQNAASNEVWDELQDESAQSSRRLPSADWSPGPDSPLFHVHGTGGSNRHRRANTMSHLRKGSDISHLKLTSSPEMEDGEFTNENGDSKDYFIRPLDLRRARTEHISGTPRSAQPTSHPSQHQQTSSTWRDRDRRSRRTRAFSGVSVRPGLSNILGYRSQDRNVSAPVLQRPSPSMMGRQRPETRDYSNIPGTDAGANVGISDSRPRSTQTTAQYPVNAPANVSHDGSAIISESNRNDEGRLNAGNEESSHDNTSPAGLQDSNAVDRENLPPNERGAEQESLPWFKRWWKRRRRSSS